MSPTLFNLFVNDLISLLSIKGVKVLMFADDLVFVASSLKKMTKAIDILE